MPVCNFFLQGRCRYGEKCWNEHPRGGNRGGGYSDSYNRSSGQQQARGDGGFRNRVWVNPSQQKGGYIQPSSFSSHGSNDWGRGGGGGGGGRRDDVKSSEFGFSSQNRYSVFDTPSTFDRGGRAGGGGGGGGGRSAGNEDDDKKLELIQLDMDSWEHSGQWGFSCYSTLKNTVSGFSDLSPEELRLEYYISRASGDLQSYMNGVNQLLSQWKSRVQELKTMNPSTRAALLAELNGAAPQPSSSSFGSAAATGFGSSVASFGSKGFGSPAAPQANTFSFASSNSGFGSAAAPVFGSTMAAPTQSPSGFDSSSGSASAPSASGFSFATPTSNKPAAPSGFGSASGFSFSSTTNTGGGFGSGFGAQAPAAPGNSSVFGQQSGGFGSSTAPPAQGAGSAGGASDSLFSPEDKLSEEELNQFKAKRFTLGQVPLKPPPANMLVI